MNQQTRIKILALVFIITFGAAMTVTFKSSFSSDSEIRTISYDTATVTSVEIFGDSLHVMLTEKSNESWMVNNRYPIREDLQVLMLAAFSRLEIKRPVAKENQEAVRQILSKKGYKIKINGTPAFTLAANDNDYNSSYMLREGDQEPLVIHVPGFTGPLSDLMKQDENVWRSHVLFRCSPMSLQKIKAEFPEIPKSNFEIRYVAPRQFEMVGMPLVDTAMMNSYLEQFTSVNVDDFIYKNKDYILQQLSSEKPACILEVQDLNPSMNQTLMIYGPSKKRGTFYCVLKERNELVTFSGNTLNRIIARREFFLPKQK